MKVKFENLNNNDCEHEIIFLSLTKFPSNAEEISVIFDGSKYVTKVNFDDKGRRSFRWCGKTYEFEILK